MTMTVRQATPSDASVIVEFNIRLAAESEGKALEPAVVAAGVAAAFADRHKGPYFVAEENGTILGGCQVTFEFSDWRNGWIWYFQGVYVRAEARRRGVFRALYEHIYQRAMADPEVIGLRLYVEKENVTAQQTYLALGMQWTPYLMLEKFPIRELSGRTGAPK